MPLNSERQCSVPWDSSSPVSPLGGPHSSVFRARSADKTRSVAVRSWQAANEAELQAARVRVECARYVTHASVAAVEACADRGARGLWIVSEYVPGPTLEAWAADGRSLPLPAAIDLVRSLCVGLYVAYGEGLTHHALQPCNVVVARRSRSLEPRLDAKILELGLAGWMRPEWPSLHNAHFIAPETLAVKLTGSDPSDAIDARANVYSCGALLYFLATGALPFHSSTLLDLSNAHQAGKLVAPQSLNPEISTALQTVILSALAMQPAHRYPNTGELASALAAAAWRDGYTDGYEPSALQPLPLHNKRGERTSAAPPVAVSRRSVNYEARQ